LGLLPLEAVLRESSEEQEEQPKQGDDEVVKEEMDASNS
jgi:hypothetical protein